jgi:hypothetical protein
MVINGKITRQLDKKMDITPSLPFSFLILAIYYVNLINYYLSVNTQSYLPQEVGQLTSSQAMQLAQLSPYSAVYRNYSRMSRLKKAGLIKSGSIS